MKIALITFSNPKTGIGKVAFKTYHALNQITNTDFYYFQTKESKDYANIKSFRPPFGSNRFLNDFNQLVAVFHASQKIPKKHDIYHFFNPLLSVKILYKDYHPLVMTLHDLMPLKFPRKNLKDIVFRMYANSYKQADHIIAVSENTKKDAVKLLGINPNIISVVYSGVDHSLFKPQNKFIARKKLGLPLDKKIILHVGEEYYTKNIPVLLRSFKKINEEMNDVILIRLGKPSKETKKLIREEEIKNVLYLSSLSENQLPLLYSAADLFLFPSLYEGFGLPLLEAMACGCPVIASNSSAIPEVVGKAGILIDPYNINDFVKNAVKLLRNPSLSKKMSIMGIKRSKQFNWKKSAEKTVNIYKKLIK